MAHMLTYDVCCDACRQPPPSAGETERWAFADEVAFDGAYVYYVKDKKISLHTRVSHYYKVLHARVSHYYTVL
jgi:hypothetical protein